jgi:tetratricopeptide (TPR) repeat protein
VVWAYRSLGRPDEAKVVGLEALESGLDVVYLRENLALIAAQEGDRKALDEHLDSQIGTVHESRMLALEAGLEAQEGKMGVARDLIKRAEENALQQGLTEGAARFPAWLAQSEAEIGEKARAEIAAERAVSIAHSRIALGNAALALARIGELARASELAGELDQRFPRDTVAQFLWIPAIEAAVALQRGEPGEAIAALERARNFEGLFQKTIYLRGWAYLAGGSAPQAASEFQRLVRHAVRILPDVERPLSHLGLARAHILAGNEVEARKAYQTFFEAWQEADEGIPILLEARAEYESLK